MAHTLRLHSKIEFQAYRTGSLMWLIAVKLSLKTANVKEKCELIILFCNSTIYMPICDCEPNYL